VFQFFTQFCKLQKLATHQGTRASERAAIALERGWAIVVLLLKDHLLYVGETLRQIKSTGAERRGRICESRKFPGARASCRLSEEAGGTSALPCATSSASFGHASPNLKLHPMRRPQTFQIIDGIPSGMTDFPAAARMTSGNGILDMSRPSSKSHPMRLVVSAGAAAHAGKATASARCSSGAGEPAPRATDQNVTLIWAPKTSAFGMFPVPPGLMTYWRSGWIYANFVMFTR